MSWSHKVSRPTETFYDEDNAATEMLWNCLPAGCGFTVAGGPLHNISSPARLRWSKGNLKAMNDNCQAYFEYPMTKTPDGIPISIVPRCAIIDRLQDRECEAIPGNSHRMHHHFRPGGLRCDIQQSSHSWARRPCAWDWPVVRGQIMQGPGGTRCASTRSACDSRRCAGYARRRSVCRIGEIQERGVSRVLPEAPRVRRYWGTLSTPFTSAYPGEFAFRTQKGYYLTAVNGGGRTGDPTIITGATSAGAWEKFRIGIATPPSVR